MNKYLFGLVYGNINEEGRFIGYATRWPNNTEHLFNHPKGSGASQQGPGLSQQVLETSGSNNIQQTQCNQPVSSLSNQVNSVLLNSQLGNLGTANNRLSNVVIGVYKVPGDCIEIGVRGPKAKYNKIIGVRPDEFEEQKNRGGFNENDN
uniref:Uncharacterized protein n=1 Tax=Opegrapha vulgata TaxID=543791 RepID=A0A286QTC0_9PEZI|nr:hypothetical protein [Opegrapha vulgata]ASB29438.1 hypothetical protein [Opegrapha vulgata]